MKRNHGNQYEAVEQRREELMGRWCFLSKLVIVQRSGQVEDSFLKSLCQWDIFDVRMCEELREMGRKGCILEL